MARVTLYFNPKQAGTQVKNVYFKYAGKFYRTNVLVDRWSDVNKDDIRQRIRSSVESVFRGGNPSKHEIEDKGLVYAKSGVGFNLS